MFEPDSQCCGTRTDVCCRMRAGEAKEKSKNTGDCEGKFAFARK